MPCPLCQNSTDLFQIDTVVGRSSEQCREPLQARAAHPQTGRMHDQLRREQHVGGVHRVMIGVVTVVALQNTTKRGERCSVQLEAGLFPQQLLAQRGQRVPAGLLLQLEHVAPLPPRAERRERSPR